MNKKIIKLLIIVLLIFSTKVYAYDINNPKSPSKRAYEFGQLVTLENGTTWNVVLPIGEDDVAVTLLYASLAQLPSSGATYFNYATFALTAIPEIRTWLQGNLSDPTGLVVTALDTGTTNAVIQYANNTSKSWAWIIANNYWLSDTSNCNSITNYYWAINSSTGYACVDANTSGTYGYKPYIAVMKSNIIGSRSVTIGSITHGTITPSVTTYEKDEKITLTVTPDSGYELKAGTLKYGSTAIGKDSGGNYAYLGPNSNTTVTAEFDPIVYTVTYVDPKNETNPNPTTYTVESPKITLQALSRTGYVFDGWYKNADFSSKVTKISSGSTGNKTFYAKWSRDPEYPPSYEVSIPASLNLDSNNDSTTIQLGSAANFFDGRVDVSVNYPSGGFELSQGEVETINYRLYKGTSSIAANEITSVNTVVASFNGNGSQAIHFDIDPTSYAGHYTGSLTFNIEFIDD